MHYVSTIIIIIIKCNYVLVYLLLYESKLSNFGLWTNPDS